MRATAYPAIGPKRVGEVRFFWYAAADGMQIPAFLTLPTGREAEGLPLVVMPHGGPASRDEPGFDWWAQALAAEGYAVLQPQFRGSTGFGDAHLKAGYDQWGEKMQTDLSDGVRRLAADGVIDPTRVCVVGASYGGYAALAGATLDRGVYRCAVSVSGVSDLKRFLGWSRKMNGSDSVAVRFWKRFMGAKRLGDASLAQLSPALLADRVEAPVLLIHGKDDTVVPFEQSKFMADALKKAGKPHALVELAGEDHWLSGEETRTAMLRETIGFLQTHNPSR